MFLLLFGLLRLLLALIKLTQVVVAVVVVDFVVQSIWKVNLRLRQVAAPFRVWAPCLETHLRDGRRPDQDRDQARLDSTRHFGQLRASTMWAKGNGNGNRQASVLSAVFGRKSCRMNSFLAFFLVFFCFFLASSSLSFTFSDYRIN